ELDKLYAKAAKDQTAGTLARYAALLGVIERGAQPLPEPERHLGPHAIAVWGQELRADSITPQIALMIECDDSPAVRQRLFRVTQRITRLIRWLDPSLTQANLTIQQSRHFGTTIYHVPLTAYAAASKLPMARLLGGADPAWTISNGWLIVALDRPHVERILDAQLGLFPTLANVRDVQPLRRRPVNRSILSVVQPDLAAAALDKWLAAAASGAASPLNPSWWRAGSASADDPAKVLGIRLSEPSPAGAAAVASVEPGSPAAERLQPGDRIVAVDGTVLALTAAAADLRARLRQSTTATGPTWRFERGGVFQEVVLPRPDNDDAPTAQGIDPTAAVRELAALARALQFASLAVDASEPMYYSAILSLRFNADHAAPAPVHEDRPTRRNE
ncbi:MAG: PDZ domain-containing protein, partial [Phycisphaerae bacterium]